jgi:hypothetical protein
MHYAGGHMPRIDQANCDAQIDQEIQKLKNIIKRGDDELSAFRERYPYNTFDVMNKAAGWNQERYRHVGRLTELSRQRQGRMVDQEWRPATPGFVGSER